MDTIGKRLQHFRELRGLSASQVARNAGVAVSTYRDWEKGRLIKGEPYERLAKIFNVSLSELLIGGDANRQQILSDLDGALGLLAKVKNSL